MKKLIRCFFVPFSFLFLISNEVKAQTASVTINYGGFTNQCCSANTIPYYCFNDPVTCGAPCGCNTATHTQTFTNPVPAGNIITQVDASWFALNCGGSASATIDGTSIGSTPIINGSCLCSSLGSGATGNSTINTYCGLAGFNNAAGALETFVATFTGEVCISSTVLTFHYAPASQAVPANQPGGITGPTSACSGVGGTYSIASVSNAIATGYNWTIVPSTAGTINSGQGSTSVNASFTAAGQICVTASNLCGTSSPQCLSVALSASSTAPTSASANPASICPGGTSTLTVSGGSLGTGASYTWHTGSCAGTVVGTGASISVSPSSATTYYVNATGGCATTGCAQVTVNIGGTTATPGAPTGNTSPCGGSSQVFTTSGTSGATSYAWTVPAGSTITAGGTGTSITVTLGSTSGNVCVTATGACGTSAAACTPITITNIPTTPGTITGTTPVCLGSDNYSITAIPGATGYNWATTGGGTISNGNTPTATINWTTPGAYIVSVTANNACGTSSQNTFNVTVNPPPTITINSSTLTVCSGSSATFTASGASTYTWTPIGTITPTTGAVVTATPVVSPTVYTVTATDGNGCKNSNTVSINVTPTPTVTTSGGGGNSQTVCGGGLVNSTIAAINFVVTPAGSVNWTNSNTGIGLGGSGTGNIGSYPAPAITGSTSTVATITATATSGGCASTSATQLVYTITINQIPGATTAAINPAGCGQNNGTITGPTGTGGSGFYSYSWDNVTYSSSSSYTNGAGTYPVYIKDNTTGCIYSQNFTIPNAGAPAPPAVTPSSTAACVGSTVTLTVNAPVAGTTYSWTPVSGTGGTGNSFSITIPLGAPNPFTIDVTATASGCTGTAGTTSITVNQPPAPAISSVTNGQVCAGSNITLNATPNGPNYSYQWGNSGGPLAGATSNTLSVGTAGTYSVLVTDNNTSCSGFTSANGTVTVNTLPVIDTTGVTVTQSSCVTATGSVTNVSISGNPSFTYTWTSGSATGTAVGSGTGTNPTLSNVSAGVYCLNVTDGNTCTKTFCSITVTNAGAPPQPVLSTSVNDTIYCQGDNILPLVVTVANTGTTTPTVNWYSNPALTTVLPGGNNTYTYTPTGIAVGVPTTIYVAASAGGCLSTSRPITILINPLPIPPVVSGTTTANNTYCQGATINPLTVSAPVTTPVTIPVWYNSAGQVVATGNSYTPTGAGVYTVIDSVESSNGCKSSSLANGLHITVTINPSPSINLSGAVADTAKCGQPTGGVHGIANATGGTPVIHYQWTGPGTTSADTLPNLAGVSAGGSYSLQITDANGCHALGTGTLGVNTFTVPVVVSPIASFSTNPSPATGGVPLTVAFTNETTVGVTSSTIYVWNFGDGPNSFAINPTHTYTAANTYTATLIAYNGTCASSPVSVIIMADVPTTMIIPNIFTPNGDGKNDEFFIINTGMVSLNCQIFNRWGQLMYTLTAPNQSWDGIVPNGDKAPEGTYMYILQAQGEDGKAYKQNGTIMLMR